MKKLSQVFDLTGTRMRTPNLCEVKSLCVLVSIELNMDNSPQILCEDNSRTTKLNKKIPR